MSNVNITIGTPVLVAGEHFKVRYRLLPAGSFSAPQNQTNAQFTLTGLSDGNYELEVTVVKADGSECPPTYQTFTVVTPFECIEFEAEIVQQDNGMFYLVITYTPPMTGPACGWDIIYNGNTVHYATLPASPLNIPVPNASTSLQIIADNCNGNRKACFSDDIDPVAPTCTPLVITSATLTPQAGSTPSSPTFDLKVSFTQSVPCSVGVGFIGNQLNVFSGIPSQFSYLYPAYGTVCSSPSVAIGVKPNTNVQNVFDPLTSTEKKKYEYSGVIIDVCGKTHPWSCSILY